MSYSFINNLKVLDSPNQSPQKNPCRFPASFRRRTALVTCSHYLHHWQQVRALDSGGDDKGHFIVDCFVQVSELRAAAGHGGSRSTAAR